MKIGISTTFNYDIPLVRMLALIKAAGFDAFSLGGNREHSNYHTARGRREIKILLAQNQLILDSIHAPFKNDDGDLSALDDALRARSVANVENAVDAAVELNSPIVVIHLDARFKGPATGERIDRVRKSMEKLVPYARTKNVRLACENLDTPAKQEIFETILAEFTPPPVGVCYDTSHGRLTEKDFGVLRRYGNRLFTIHVNDCHGVEDEHLLPYEGMIDWQEFGRVFKSINFKGAFMLEPEMRLSQFKEPEIFLKEALLRAKRILEE